MARNGSINANTAEVVRKHMSTIASKDYNFQLYYAPDKINSTGFSAAVLA